MRVALGSAELSAAPDLAAGSPLRGRVDAARAESMWFSLVCVVYNIVRSAGRCPRRPAGFPPCPWTPTGRSQHAKNIQTQTRAGSGRLCAGLPVPGRYSSTASRSPSPAPRGQRTRQPAGACARTRVRGGYKRVEPGGPRRLFHCGDPAHQRGRVAANEFRLPSDPRRRHREQRTFPAARSVNKETPGTGRHVQCASNLPGRQRHSSCSVRG